MKIKLTSIALATTLATASFATHAAPGPAAALNACVKAFTATYLPGHPVGRTKIIGSSAPSSVPTWTRNYTIGLTAIGTRSGNVLAEARCVAGRDGVVVVLESPPTRNYLAKADFVVSVR